MEFISWATNNHTGIWAFFDVMNALRGLWLLIFCVFLSKRVRSRLLRTIYKTPALGSKTSRGNTVHTSSSNKANSETSAPIELAIICTNVEDINDKENDSDDPMANFNDN